MRTLQRLFYITGATCTVILASPISSDAARKIQDLPGVSALGTTEGTSGRGTTRGLEDQERQIGPGARGPQYGPAPSLTSDEEELVAEAERRRKALDRLLEASPLGTLELANRGLTSASADAVEKLASLLAHPAVKNYLRLFSSESFSRSMRELSESTHWKGFWVGEGILLILFLGYRSWRRRRLLPSEWFRRIWLRLWTSFVYLLLAISIVPALAFGTSYLRFLRGMLEIRNLNP